MENNTHFEKQVKNQNMYGWIFLSNLIRVGVIMQPGSNKNEYIFTTIHNIVFFFFHSCYFMNNMHNVIIVYVHVHDILYFAEHLHNISAPKLSSLKIYFSCKSSWAGCYIFSSLTLKLLYTSCNLLSK